MRARHRLASSCCAASATTPGRGGRWTLKHRHWLPSSASTTAAADDLRRLSARPRRPARAPRPWSTRELEQLAAECVVGRDDRAVVLPARDQHPDRARAVRRDRRLAALRSPGRDRQLRRAGPVRAQLRRQAAAWARSPRPAPPTPADCWSRPRCTTASRRRSAASSPPPARPGPGAHRPRLARPAPAQRAAGSCCATPAASRPAIVTIAIARELAAPAGRSPPPADPDHTRLARRGGAAVRASRTHERPRFRL